MKTNKCELVKLARPAVSAAALGLAYGLWAASPVLKDGVLTYEVAATDTETKAFSSYGAVSKVVKTGAGVLDVSADNSAYAGTVEIEEGSACMKNGNALGGKSATVYVRNGASLRTDYVSAQSDRTINCPVHIVGDGPDHKGAIYCTNASMGDNMFQDSVYLDGPATVGGSSRFGFYAVMNGHTLTNAIAVGQHIFRGVNASAPGHVVYTGSGIHVVSGSFNGSEANTFTIATSGGRLGWWNSGVAPAWTLLVKENGGLSGGNGSSETVNCWGGPIVIDRGRTLTLGSYNNNCSSGAKGVISGEGGVTCNGNDANFLGYLFSANTYTGATKVTRGTLVAKANKSIPEASPITLDGGSLRYVLDSGCWELSEVYRRLAKTSVPNGSVRLWTSNGQNVTDALGFTLQSANMGIGHDGPGALTTTGKIVGGVLNNWAGTWTISPTEPGSSATRVRLLDNASGKMVFKDAGYWYFGTATSEVGSANTPRLVLDDTAFGGKETTGGSSRGAILNVANAQNTRGVVELIGDKASMTNFINLGNAAKSVGAVYQNGGTVLMSCNSTADGHWGGGGYGFYDVAKGKLSVGHCLNMGYVGDGSRGTAVLRVSGGKVTLGGDLFVNCGATGVVHMTSGEISCATSNLRLGQRQWSDGGARGLGIFTVDGENAVASLNCLSLGQRPDPSFGVANINRGVLAVKTAIGRMPTNFGDTFYTEANQPKGYVNFNGGTLRALASIGFFSTEALTKPTKVTAFEGGATFDANGFSATVNQPVEAPTGCGVTSIDLPAEFVQTGWLGPQHVAIFGGSGHGATAITDFDQASGKITKIIVTSPGQGYQEGDVVTAAIPNASNNGVLACTAHVSALVSGGLTVTNSSATAGTVTLKEVNTYAGATVVAAGTLKLGVAGAIPAGSAVTVVAGKGVLDLNGFAWPTGSTLTVDCGSLPLAPANFAQRHLTLVKGIGATMPTVTNLDSLPYPWTVELRNGNLTACCKVGMMIQLK